MLISTRAGQLNQEELSARIDPFLFTPGGETEHLHNQLIVGIYCNVTRDMPDTGVASWVSANDKPTTGAGSKPVTGDAAEQRLKTEVMQLPSRDRRRLKDLSQNEVRGLTFAQVDLQDILTIRTSV
jgi:transcriptional coactivator HFI1/ADA1